MSIRTTTLGAVCALALALTLPVFAAQPANTPRPAAANRTAPVKAPVRKATDSATSSTTPPGAGQTQNLLPYLEQENVRTRDKPSGKYANQETSYRTQSPTTNARPAGYTLDGKGTDVNVEVLDVKQPAANGDGSTNQWPILKSGTTPGGNTGGAAGAK